MSKMKTRLTHRNLRSVLTDMLPFEVPPTFSNKGFYRFIKDIRLELTATEVLWEETADRLDKVICLIFGCPDNTLIESKTIVEWGKTKQIRSLPRRCCKMDTIPFSFRVAHKNDGRTLTVVHPRNQIEVAAFYGNHNSLIVYYSNLSAFSIRKPVSVSRYAYFKDRLHSLTVDREVTGIEIQDLEYEQLGSYFVYKSYRNIHKFFESYKYHRCERKYNAMMQVDIGKCFDSIYTHSLPWAILGNSQTKHFLEESKSTFAGRFDDLMQRLNQKETNGIVIGPEFSRIFAEIILQSVDVEAESILRRQANLHHKVHYEVFRYVDDYFVFYNEESTQQKVLEVIQEVLKSKKMSFNPAKIRYYKKPIITEITIAKTRVSALLNEELRSSCEAISGEVEGGTKMRFVCKAWPNRLITEFKAALKQASVSYEDLLNYTLSIVESKVDQMLRNYKLSDRSTVDAEALLRSLMATTEFSFFVYSASPKVNHTVRLCRIISTEVDFLNREGFNQEMKHLLFKYIHDNIREQLEKNEMAPYREVETLYLLAALAAIGKSYWIPELTLVRYFRIRTIESDGSYQRDSFLNYFAITMLLTYIKNKLRYSKLRNFLESHILEKIESIRVNHPKDTEFLMLVLDLIVCPYVSDGFKEQIAQMAGFPPSELANLQTANSLWFTAWADFDLGKVLDAKRSREVY